MTWGCERPFDFSVGALREQQDAGMDVARVRGEVLAITDMF
jgi:hypothetical protein